MEDKDFCLLEYPWIWVNTSDMEPKEVSLIEVMTHAQDYISLAGETPTQDAAIFRFLLAIALTVFYRYDEDNQEKELSEKGGCDAGDVLERWKAYWDRGSFPEGAIKTYLETYRERFYLFHPQTPFYQVNGMYEKKYGTECPAKCLMGNLKESGNPATRHHFSMAEGKELEKLSYGEAARWLIHLNAYGANVVSQDNVPGTKEKVGVGRQGQLGMVMLKGETLFRTLMLNLCPLKGSMDLWGSPNPAWEKQVCIEQGMEIAPPDNLPELYTIQSRRISLKREERKVTGAQVMGGEFYPAENDFNEPMTLWKKETKKGMPTVWRPKCHDSLIYAWKEFPALLNRGENEEHIPGIIQWMNLLFRNKILVPRELIRFQMVGMKYNGTIKRLWDDCVSNSLDVSEDMLTDFAKEWIDRITEEVNNCKKVGDTAIKPFAAKLNKIYYASEEEVKKSNLKDVLVRNYYFSIDNAFRTWLASIDPMQEEKEEKLAEWRETSYRCAEQTVEEYLSAHKPKLYAYRENKKEILTVPKAINQFHTDLRKIYPQTEIQGKEWT